MIVICLVMPTNQELFFGFVFGAAENRQVEAIDRSRLLSTFHPSHCRLWQKNGTVYFISMAGARVPR